MYNANAAEKEETIESKYSAADFTPRKKLTMAALLLGFCGLIFGIVGLAGGKAAPSAATCWACPLW